MQKLFFLSILSYLFLPAFAQDEAVGPLQYNAKVYTATKSQLPQHSHRYLVEGTMIVTTDTLNLPFVDDFTRNNLGTVNWNQNHITDTFYNVFGTCLAIEGVPLIEDYFMNDTAWSYTYDTLTHSVDSVPNPSIAFTFFGPATNNCFSQGPSPFTYWNTYHRYTFDSVGRVTDSVLVNPTDTIFYAPVVYFVNGEPGKLWTDNYAYVNNTYPINPPTIGVATLDGLNEYGLPYNSSSNNTYGRADYLTSKPINLSTIAANDSTVYLSFFVEPQGLGDYPDMLDSLILEFKDNSGEWRMMWNDTGYISAAQVKDSFQRVMVQVPQLPFPYTYFYPTFQFRFRNDASLYGNNDHWHIDYVKLDKNRSAVDTNIYDIAFQYPFPTILKNFTLMPADQFIFPDDLRDSIVFQVHNLDPNANSNPPATNFVRGATELYPAPGVIAADVLTAFNASEYDFSSKVFPNADYNIPSLPTWPLDSIVTSSRVLIQPNDSRASNDTLYHTQHFDNTLAYDDGSAEAAYGITGVGLKKFAYEFNLNQPDTLTAFQVQYSQVEGSVSNLVFNFYAWDSLKMNDFLFNDTIGQILEIDNKKPYYIDSMNGFTTYKLDTPIIVSGKIYFGWAQSDTRRLQVGYDLNSTLGRKHMYIFSNSTWKPSSITPDGSPMIRLIFDSNFYGVGSAINNLTEDKNTITVYPNPTNGYLNIRSENRNALFEADVINMLGETVKHEQNISDRLNINELQSGIYLLSLHDVQTGKVFHSKIIKTAF